jgi:hypothetical protein
MSQKKITAERVTEGRYAKDQQKLNAILFDIDKRLKELERLIRRIQIKAPPKEEMKVTEETKAIENEDNESNT